MKPDPVIDVPWAALPRELVWYPERHCGFYPVANAPAVYDGDYWRKYLAYAETEMGRKLTEARVDLVRRFAPAARVLDFGIGSGQFVEAIGGTGYDIMPAAIEWLNARRLYEDPYVTRPEVVTCWDSLEHIPYPWLLVSEVRRMVFVSIPIFDGPDHVLRSKHFRRDEHFHYYTEKGLLMFFDRCGFDCVHVCRMEERHGREDIGTFVFQRCDQ